MREIVAILLTFNLIERSKYSMNIKKETLTGSYSPVLWDYRELIDEAIKQNRTGKIFFFSEEGIGESAGRILEMKEIKSEGVFVFLDTEEKIRIDRIITLFGKPGAAYDEYDAYANACMDCMGGYEKDEL
jgi:hypothetical protein